MKSKQTIVFVHYFGGNKGSWKWLFKKLDHNYNCVAFNLPGFGGRSPMKEKSIVNFARCINDEIENLKLDSYILCGHSMGAKLILYAAEINNKQKPESLILIAPSPPTVEKMSKSEKERMLIHPSVEQAKNTVDRVTKKKLNSSKYSYATNSQLIIDESTWDWWIEEGMNENVASQIKGSNLRTDIICSVTDPVISMQDIAEEVIPYLENYSLNVFNSCGHLIPMEKPKKLAKHIRNVLSKKHLKV